MNTGMMINLIDSLFLSFEIMKGLVKSPLKLSSRGGMILADRTVAEYLPQGSLRSIRLSNGS